MNKADVPDAAPRQGDGWEEAESETLRIMQRMTFEQKLDWLEQAQRLVADLHGWEAALQPGGTLVEPRRQQN